MTERVKAALRVLRAQEYKKNRIEIENYDLTEQVIGLPKHLRRPAILRDMLERQTPYFWEGDIYGFNRTVKNTPFFVDENGETRAKTPGNLTIHYGEAIENGLDAKLSQIAQKKAGADAMQLCFYEAMEAYIGATYDFCDRYREAALREGKQELADALSRIPRKGAQSFYEACLFHRILLFVLHCTGSLQLTFGRFDQYMKPFFEADLAGGKSREELLEILELYFISVNLDGDLYIGLQQGDNGQSLVLGGYDREGNDCFGALSALCMDASLELSLIDPKINLRVSKKTPDALYEYGTKLTKQGLGFPQYCNDDIAVPFLISLGYEEEDAWNYTVAACWEYIVPNCGADAPNKGTMIFPLCVHRAIHGYLMESESFDELMEHTKEEVRLECERIRVKHNSPRPAEPDPHLMHFISAFVDGCIEKGRDIAAGGAKYRNYGSHGAGISTAADSLAAVRKLVFDEKSVTREELLAALNANFVGYETLRSRLLACPKMGNNEDYVDALAGELMDTFANTLNGSSNGNGGIWRAGTGSAHGYMVCARNCPATADGRKAGDPFGCSFSPSLQAKLNGPLSVIQSFTKFDLRKICNGGPLTMELHDTVFRNEEGEKKVAQLVKAFIMLGGHQLQLNALNRERLLQAKEDPAADPNLIVRVWGWSGYFCELDPEYQEHIIRRTAFMV